MVRAIISAGLALALVAGAAHAQAPAGAPGPKAPDQQAADPQTYALARDMVVAEGFRARLSRLDVVEPMYADQIVQALHLTDPAGQERIRGVVHKHWQALEDELVEARVSMLAQTSTRQELEGVLAFGRSPAGQALRAAAPELNRALMAAVFSAPAPDGAAPPPLSERKIALVKRILRARNVEADAHTAWRTLNAMMAQAASELEKPGAPPVAPPEHPAAEDAYVQRMMTAETQFYGRTFSEDQLAELAAYFEGPIAQAFNARAPQYRSAAAKAVREVFDRQYQLTDEDACEAVACTPSRRAALDARLDQGRSMIAKAVDAVAQ